MWVGHLDDYYLAEQPEGVRDDASIVDAPVNADASDARAPDATDAGDAADTSSASDVADAAPNSPLSCAGLPHICGAAGDRDCCATASVPGGTFLRSFDGVADGGYEDAGWPATVHDFSLDTYEITVGRFRRFVAAYPANFPAASAGRNPHDPADTGWQAAWNSDGSLPADGAALQTALQCSPYSTWTSTPQSNEALPANCLTWYLAFAFCIWDGGRLPTEAEWNYAASGGNEQRVYPWSVPPSSTLLDQQHAAYGIPAPAVVGSRSTDGDGRWGHADLSGNVWEWLLDSAGLYGLPCDGCGSFSGKTPRASRGACFGCLTKDLRTAARGSGQVSDARPDRGGRCARDP
jgi:formylglycine-generating enzyme required for sulfatase activity